MNATKQFQNDGVQPIPARAGVGLKHEHYQDILEGRPDIGWFEVHAENYMGAGGPPHYYLTKIRQDYPLSVHGVGLSIGSHGALNASHLARLKTVIDRYEPAIFSEHLAWSSHDDTYYNDLLPVPYTEETLTRVVEHIAQVQEALGRQMLLENPSTYVQFANSEMDEVTFLKEIVKRSGCGLLLDVNNIYVSASNHNYDPVTYINNFPLDHVGEIHLGGHSDDSDDTGAPLLIDSHDREVIDPVWKLYQHTIRLSGPRPTLIEWDSNLPDWTGLLSEAKRADAAAEAALRGDDAAPAQQRSSATVYA